MSDVFRGVGNIKTFDVNVNRVPQNSEKVDNIIDSKIKFNYNQESFTSIRQALTYSKAKLFGDKEVSDAVLKEQGKEAVERLDSSIKGQNNSTWDQAKSRIAYSIFKEGIENSPQLNDVVNKGVGSNLSYIDKMADKVKKDKQENNLSNMPLEKIVKRFNRNIGLSI